MSLRFKLPPGAVPPAAAARYLGLGPEEFKLKLVDLLARGFPAPDPTTGNYCFEAMQKWLRAQHPRQFPDENRLTPATARDAKDVVRARLAGGQSG